MTTDSQRTFILKEATRLLAQDRVAMLYAFLLMLIPYTGWLSLAILALVTLRKGWQHGSVLLIPVMTAHILVSLYGGLSLPVALVAALVRSTPCYLAASVLRFSVSWKVVALSLLMFVLAGAFSLHCFAPHFIQAQYMVLEAMLKSMESGQIILNFWQGFNLKSDVLAEFLFGFQAVGLILTTLIPIWFARSIQSKLYYPGEFRQEMLSFRGDRWSVGLLLIFSIGAYGHYPLAMNGLPLVLFYFILAGLSFGAQILSKMKPLGMFAMLFAPLMLLPWVVLPIYIMLGAFDGLFNFRLYLQKYADKAR